MGIFNDNIKNNTDLQSFHDYWKKYIEDRFDEIYNRFDGRMGLVSSYINGMLLKSTIRTMFTNHGIYHPWLYCQLAIGKDYHSIVQIVIFYSEDPTIYVHDKAKIFLSLNLSIPSLS